MGKYKNKKTVLDGIAFDSAKEARRYAELLLLQKSGAIDGLRTQVKYILIPAQYDGKRCAERECSYIADFVYTENGKTVVEDVKGYRDPKSAAYAKFVIKRKLMRWLYGIGIRDV